jgi:ADP-ribose 1''-phosphate phosphatase
MSLRRQFFSQSLTWLLHGQYPAAYKIHNHYCKATSADQLIGTCQLIPPQRDDYERVVTVRRPPSKRRKIDESEDEKNAAQKSPGSKRHWIACLFTSKGYGKATKTHPGMDKPEVILENTKKSLVDLKEQLLERQHEGEKDEADTKAKRLGSKELPGELWSCRFNSGLFAVDWADTRKVLEEELKSVGKAVRVVSPAES